jgi:hypothetical protein
MHAYMHAYIHVCLHARMHICIHASMHACMQICVHARMHEAAVQKQLAARERTQGDCNRPRLGTGPGTGAVAIQSGDSETPQAGGRAKEGKTRGKRGKREGGVGKGGLAWELARLSRSESFERTAFFISFPPSSTHNYHLL